VRIALVTPARPGSRSGNRHTALRWAAFLRAAGHSVALGTQWNVDPRTELLLALHARRSYDSIRAFAQRHPGRPLVLALTGTDVYRDIHVSDLAQASLRMATRFIVLQPKAKEELPPRLRRRVHVVVQSSATRLRQRPVRRHFRVCVVGHLREEKDPLRALDALRHLDPDAMDIEVLQIGGALDKALAVRARAAMRREPRYHWLGAVSHASALRWLASSHLMVISSRMEGGANVVSEAIRIGVPVLASRISGNVGLLGATYPAYFPLGDDRALARLILHAASDSAFYAELKRRVRLLRPRVSPSSEQAALLAALFS
jgi:putative glycosyltransferase (TIGR04348 family)